jgi:hypothetical protein
VFASTQGDRIIHPKLGKTDSQVISNKKDGVYAEIILLHLKTQWPYYIEKK